MSEELTLGEVKATLSQHMKKIIVFSLLVTAIAAVTAFLLPKQYLATATLIPGNPSVADKTMIFSEGRIQPVPNVGTAEDLDRIYATATLDEVFRKTVDSLSLVSHYGINEPGDTATSYAVDKLKEKQSKIYKTENGEVKIRIWDKDRKVSADIANVLAYFVQLKNQEIINKTNNSVLVRLQKTIEEKQSKLTATDSVHLQASAVYNEIAELKKMALQYQLALTDKAEAAVLVESAHVPATEDKPKKLLIILTAFFSSLVFASLLSLLLKRLK